MLSQFLVPKARRPKFELSLKIYDLNNVPLVSGTSLIKWHLPSSTSAEHRGHTQKAPIKEHKVCWNYEKTIPLRLTMDKTNMLQECIIHFDIYQEYNTGARADKILLGHVELNLTEYVELHDQDGEYGITRRYLMQESKINSTLKVGISMRQLDGERNFIAPPLRTAAVFGGIAGVIDFEQGDQDDQGNIPSISRSREAGELQDMYRSALAASWGAQVGELPADQCIEDIFGGGNGWKSSGKMAQDRSQASRQHTIPRHRQQSDEEDYEQILELPRHHHRTRSGSSTRSMTTITGKTYPGGHHGRGHKHSGSRDRGILGTHHRTTSRSSLDSQQHESSSESSDKGKFGFKHAQEVDEFAVREDLMAWKLPSTNK